MGHEKIISEKYVNPGQKRPAQLLLWQYTLSGCGHIEVDGSRPRPVPVGSSFLAQLPSDHNYYFKKESEYWEFVWVVLPVRPFLPSVKRLSVDRFIFLIGWWILIC